MSDPNAGVPPEASTERLFCGRCDFYTDHVSTAHDGLAARGLLRSRGEGLVSCADCEHVHTPDRCVGGVSSAGLWSGVGPGACACPCPGPGPGSGSGSGGGRQWSVEALDGSRCYTDQEIAERFAAGHETYTVGPEQSPLVRAYTRPNPDAEWEALPVPSAQDVAPTPEVLAWGWSPYDTLTPAEVVHDYVAVRGDLVAEYARAQLASWIERYAAQAAHVRAGEVWAEAVRELFDRGLIHDAALDEGLGRNPYSPGAP
jgi:hypothetical protein